MGCDIHCYIEYKNKNDTRWRDFGGRINPGRYYSIFSKMAGVRSYGDDPPVVPPRGRLTDMAYAARDDDQLYITDSNEDGCTAPDRAKEWVDRGISTYINNHEGKPTWVTSPDHHSHSWLTAAEFQQALGESALVEYTAMLAAMKHFEDTNHDCRLVFWFDN